MSRTLINTLADRKTDRHPMLEEAGCGGSCSTPPPSATRLALDAPPVRVNGIVIEETEIAREVQHHGGASIEEARAAAARALVIRRLLLDRSAALNLTPAPETDPVGRWESDEEALVRQVLEAEAPPQSPTSDECRRFYEARRATFPMSFEVAEPVIRNRLMARAWLAASASYVARLMREANVEGLSASGGVPP